MTAPIPKRTSSPRQRESREELATRIRLLVSEHFDASCAVETLDRATGGDYYICGGTIRRGLLGDSLSGDLDLIVSNGDYRALAALDDLGVPFVLNSNGHRRYRWNALQIDIFQPREFFKGFGDVESVLHFFDLKINAVALHMATKRVLDPFLVLNERSWSDPGINWARWREMTPLQLVVLSIRLAKILYETPMLRIPPADVQRLRSDVVPHLRACNWEDVHQRFPLGKDEFLRVFSSLIAHE